MAATIGKWNPAWGPEPQWQGPAANPRRHYPKNRPLLLRCPTGCTAEDVVIFGPRAAYYCAVCGSEMEVAQLVRERPPPPAAVQPGERYGRLVVQQVIRGGGNPKAWCLCDCGTTKAVRADHLRDGSTRSCGCLARERFAAHPWRRDSR